MLLSRSPLLHLASLTLLAATPRAQSTTLYPVVDHVQGSLIQTAAAPVRPVLIDSAGEVWAVNTGQSTVERFAAVTQPLNPKPLEVRQVPWAPVSIVEWTPSSGGNAELLIVCRNTWGLLRMAKSTGNYKEWIPLPAEPSDIVVDAVRDRAFVSCTGADAVVQIDLLVRDGKFHRRYDETTTRGATELLGDLQIKSPYFLHLMPDGKVRVAPLHSGNNTTVTQPMFANRDNVVSLAGRINQLPDKDVFEIDPGAASLTDAVSPVATGVGTILFAHGRNPGTGAYWVLNTDADNANPARQNEPALKGTFLTNRLTVLGAPHDHVSFEPTGLPPFTPDTTIGQPFALAFHAPEGNAFVAGLLTNNVTLFDSAGTRQHEIDLPPGSIPRGLAIAPPDSKYLAVYCWGTAKVELYTTDHGSPALPSSHVGTYSLSNDPLTAEQREGRRIFFDGTLSNPDRKNISCASCHVDGGSDFLAWNLSGLPYDDKGPMVTQTLIGLERVGPFHWRGERTLEDFNLFAFPGLLGHTGPLPAADFAKMKAWLFSLRNPANPFEHRERILANGASSQFIAPTQTREFRSDLRALATANPSHQLISGQLVPALATSSEAVEGLDHFSQDLVFEGRWRCTQCHSFPVGTNNDLTDDEVQASTVLPERMHFKNAPFHEIWRKHQSLVVADTQEAGGAQSIDVRTFLGAGVAHAGGVPDVLRFAQAAAGGANFVFPPRVAALMQQWDQGLAPAAHYAYQLMAGPTGIDVLPELQTYLLGQASRAVRDAAPGSALVPNCDIAVIQYSLGVKKTWFLNRALTTTDLITKNQAVFSPDDKDEPNRSLQWFINQASAITMPPSPLPSFLFLGVPVGMAERLVADFDMDGIRNRDEDLTTNDLYVVNPDPLDSTPPVITLARFGRLATDQTTFFDASTNNVRLYVETDQPTTLRVTYDELLTSGSPTVTSPYLSRVHSLVLTDLRPSTSAPSPADPEVTGESVSYQVDIEATDTAGLMDDASLVLGTTADFSMPFDLDAGTGSPSLQLRHEHVLTAPPLVDVGTLNGPGNRLVTVDLSATLKQGADHVAAASRVFAVRVFRVRGSEPPLRLDAGAGLVNTLTGTRFTQQLRIRTGSSTRALAGTGTLVINTTPASAPQLRFRVSGGFVQPGDKLIVQVEGIVESTSPTVLLVGCSLNLCTEAEVTTASQSALSQWDFPRTTESNMQGFDFAPTP